MPADAGAKTEKLIAALRCARIRIQLLGYQIDEIGVALKFRLISADDALEWLCSIDAEKFLVGPPPSNRGGRHDRGHQ